MGNWICHPWLDRKYFDDEGEDQKVIEIAIPKSEPELGSMDGSILGAILR